MFFKVFDGGQEWSDCGKSQAGFMYADDVCLITSNKQDLQTIFIL